MPGQQPPPPLPPRSTSVASSIVSWSSSDDGRSYSPNRPGTRTNTVHLTPQTRYTPDGNRANQPYPGSTGIDDPRSSSTQSLRPVESAGPNRRRLLLVYIHGFMGTETSFKSFPAHVHNVLTMSLARTHVVHSKIYPRYQSRKNVSFARDAFSNWLTPHESDDTDVILIGHSLGGILAAEVVLFPSQLPGSQNLFQHRILGHIAFDTPFLGMHPGVVGTGIASLFRSAPDPPEPGSQTGGTGSAALSVSPFEAETADPNFNPVFGNDVVLPTRSGTSDRAFYFLNKHYGDWRKAATTYVKSHLEFGGCMADYDGLKKRYRSFRPLENIDSLGNHRSPSGKLIPRVRFVNYYTASTGRIKPRPEVDENLVLVAETETVGRTPSDPSTTTSTSHLRQTPSISVEEPSNGENMLSKTDALHVDDNTDHTDTDMQYLDPQAEPPSPIHEPEADRSPVPDLDVASLVSTETDDVSMAPNDTMSVTSSVLISTPLPPLPSPPIAPEPFDAAPYASSDPATLKLAQKEHARLVKSYERAKKDYEKSVRDRERHIAKLDKIRQKQEEKENANLSHHEKSEKARLKKEAERMQKEKERMEGGSKDTKEKEATQPPTINQEAHDAAVKTQDIQEADSEAKNVKSKKSSKPPKPPKEPKPQKDRKFCALPSVDAKTGKPDQTWIRVYMENMDEVVAHTSLFFVSEAYAKLVGDTAQRIEEWLEDDATVKAIKEAQSWQKHI